MIAKGIDKVTREWIRNPSDEHAAAAGCRFDPERGQYVVDWMRNYLRLYEGEWAGQPFECRDWQYECIMRIFSWVRYDDHWAQMPGASPWVRRFTQAVIFIPKKNKKSPTLAAIGLYLLAGDGEQGGKTFFYAKDGQQAREIAGRHALEMLRQCPSLMAQCVINKSTSNITHGPTKSILRPASSGDERSQKSQEGINGNILVDEVHVVDARLMDRVKRAGISRKEPLQVEVSTAGNDPDSYGKWRFDYTSDVINGRIIDQRLFGYIAAAPQSLTDKELDADPVRYGKMANPAWGHTVREQEYLADYEESKSLGPSGLASFKMYRLNVWQHAANPLLDVNCWGQCEGAYALEDLRGLGGGIGIDLSKNDDMSAIVFCCQDGNDIKLWPLFWMTKQYAEDHNHLASFLDWAAAGQLQLVDANAIKPEDLLPRTLEAIEVIRPRLVCFDPTFCSAFAESLEEDHGITAAKFQQNHTTYSEPTTAFKQALLDLELRHPGNAVLTWQASHVAENRRDNLIKPVKPDAANSKVVQRHRKIDGITAAIMAFHAMRSAPPPTRSVYETRGPIVIGA